jgi:apolipoprotein N-acyltransferase
MMQSLLRLQSRWQWYLLGLVSSILLSGAWYFAYSQVFMFFGFVPLLIVEHNIRQKNLKYPKWNLFLVTYWSLAIWNILTTYWVGYASVEGAIGMVFFNTLFMTIPVILFSQIKYKIGQKWGIWAFLVCWISYEYFHLNWDLNWIWLIVGNGFASVPEWVQWYEFTGVLGGSIWIIVCNILIFKYLLEQNKKYLWQALVIFVLPLMGSYLRFFTYQTPKGEQIETVMVQPNIDPYNEKFPNSPRFIPFEKQLQRLLKLSDENITAKTQLLIFPETALDQTMHEDQLKNYPTIKMVDTFLKIHPKMYLVTGITSLQGYGQVKKTATARFHVNFGYYDYFNTALFMNANVDSIAVYHKSRLVPAVESMPYPKVLNLLSKLVIDLGGTSGMMGVQPDREVFWVNKTAVAPIICYESLFGQYVGDYVKKGANLLCVISNDGWWGSSAGYVQHLKLSQLRCVETRREMLFCANTGLTAFLNQKGEVTSTTRFWEIATLKGVATANNEITFYVKFGDYLGIMAAVNFLIMLSISIIIDLKRKKTI